MTGFSLTSENASVTAPGGATAVEFEVRESLSINDTSDRRMGGSAQGNAYGCQQAGGLADIHEAARPVGRHSLAFGKTVARRGVGRSVPKPFFESRRNLNGDVESGGSYRLGSVSAD